MIKDQFEPVHTLNWIFWDFSGLSNKLLYERTADQKKKKKKLSSVQICSWAVDVKQRTSLGDIQMRQRCILGENPSVMGMSKLW